MFRLVRRLALAVLAALLALPLAAQPADLGVSYQGRLTDADGRPVTGTVEMTFRIGPLDGDGGLAAADYAVTRQVEVVDGVFSVALGGGAEDGFAGDLLLPPSVAFPGEMWFPGEEWFPGEMWYPGVEAVVEGESLGALPVQASPYANVAGGLYRVGNLASVTESNASVLVNNDGEGEPGEFAVFTGAPAEGDPPMFLVHETDGVRVRAVLSTDAFRLAEGASAGYVLTSDAGGNAAWQSVSGGGLALPFSGSASANPSATFAIENTSMGDVFRALGGGNGLHVQGAGLNGVSVQDADQAGFRADGPGTYGLAVFDASNASLYTVGGTRGLFTTGASQVGVFVANAGGDGVVVSGAGANGVEVQSAQDDGGWFRADRYGVYATGDMDGDGDGGAAYLDGDVVVDGGLQVVPGASDGYVLTSDAAGRGTWQPAGGGSGGAGFALPFSGSVSTNDAPAFEIEQAGGAPVARFEQTNPDNVAEALWVRQNGAANAAVLVLNATADVSGAHALEAVATAAYTQGQGTAGFFHDLTGGEGSAVHVLKEGGAGAVLEVDLLSDVDDADLARFASGLPGGPATTVARIDQAGNVYGATFNPGGADIAEAFAVEGDPAAYEPGDVLVISTRTDRTVERSAEAASPLVVGVYATRPGVLLAEEGLGATVPMGVVGVLPTKVSAENGPIRRGDLLVTASVPGHAMRASDDPAVGTVLGKALEPFDGPGTGRIRVLVNVK